jgi:hypothetical protein
MMSGYPRSLYVRVCSEALTVKIDMTRLMNLILLSNLSPRLNAIML